MMLLGVAILDQSRDIAEREGSCRMIPFSNEQFASTVAGNVVTKTLGRTKRRLINEVPHEVPKADVKVHLGRLKKGERREIPRT